MSDFLRQLSEASGGKRKPPITPFFYYDKYTKTLEVFLSGERRSPVQIGSQVEVLVDEATKEKIVGFRFKNMVPPEEGIEVPDVPEEVFTPRKPTV